jgi:hypothetical protein
VSSSNDPRHPVTKPAALRPRVRPSPQGVGPSSMVSLTSPGADMGGDGTTTGVGEQDSRGKLSPVLGYHSTQLYAGDVAQSFLWRIVSKYRRRYRTVLWGINCLFKCHRHSKGGKRGREGPRASKPMPRSPEVASPQFWPIHPGMHRTSAPRTVLWVPESSRGQVLKLQMRHGGQDSRGIRRTRWISSFLLRGLGP